MKSITDIRFVLTLMAFVAFLVFISTLPDIPEGAKIMTAFDFAWLASGFVGVTSACVVAPALTGAIGCPVALVIYTVATLLMYFFVFQEWIKALFIMPLILTLIYLISRLARG